MPKRADPLKKGFAPMKDKTLQNVLSHRIGTEFPRIGGPRIRQLCAQMILEVIRISREKYEARRKAMGEGFRPAEHLRKEAGPRAD